MLTRPRAHWFETRLARPVVLCGEHGLDVFCLGIFLSFFGHLVVQELSSSFLIQVLINLTGCALMIGLAALLTWYKSLGHGTGGTMGQGAA